MFGPPDQRGSNGLLFIAIRRAPQPLRPSRRRRGRPRARGQLAGVRQLAAAAGGGATAWGIPRVPVEFVRLPDGLDLT